MFGSGCLAGFKPAESDQSFRFGQVIQHRCLLTHGFLLPLLLPLLLFLAARPRPGKADEPLLCLFVQGSCLSSAVHLCFDPCHYVAQSGHGGLNTVFRETQFARIGSDFYPPVRKDSARGMWKLAGGECPAMHRHMRRLATALAMLGPAVVCSPLRPVCAQGAPVLSALSLPPVTPTGGETVPAGGNKALDH